MRQREGKREKGEEGGGENGEGGKENGERARARAFASGNRPPDWERWEG